MTRNAISPGPARTLAFDILRKVASGGYASDLLLSLTAPLDSRDAGRCSEIVFGVLRYRARFWWPRGAMATAWQAARRLATGALAG